MTEAARHTLTFADIAAINNDGIFRGSYMGECITLSPALTQQEFYQEVRKVNDIMMRVATERAKREAARK